MHRREWWTILHNATPSPGELLHSRSGSGSLRRVLGRNRSQLVAARQTEQGDNTEHHQYPWLDQGDPRIQTDRLQDSDAMLYQEDGVNMTTLLDRLCTWTQGGGCDGYCFEGGGPAPGYHSAIKWGPSGRRCQPQREVHARLFSGFAGWSSGQLEHEIRRGVWRIHSTPTAKHVLETPPSELHGLLMREILTGETGYVPHDVAAASAFRLAYYRV
jgi:hypothetical protein